MRDSIKKVILASGALRLVGDFHGPSATILMYHSVLPDPTQQADSLGGIVHSESAFRGQMELLAREYHPISLDETLKYLRDGEDLPKRSVVVTFDDGYANNYDVAMPILNELSIPATFYVTVDCVENRRLPWPSRLRFVFCKTKLAEWRDPAAKSWSLSDSLHREWAFLAACDRSCQLSGTVQEEFVRTIEQNLQTCLPDQLDSDQSGSPMMSYEQLRGLTRHGHIVGSHTMTHPNLAQIKEEEAYGELAESKQQLESQLGIQVNHFAYPCPALSPHWSERTVEQCRALGYETAVTTNSGVTRSGDNLLCLKRLRPTKTVEGLRWNLESAFAGRAV
jgi:peptidoglycan/xylan/chitin deacetylase (PgdA/CDA1 family)